MKAFKWIVAITTLSLASASFATQTNGMSVTHYEPLQRLAIQSKQGLSAQKPNRAESVMLSFDALGKSFQLRLEPNAGLLSATSMAALSDNVNIYRGSVVGAENSWVRLVTVDGVPRGLIWDGQELFALEAPGDSVLSISGPVVYRLADTFIAPGALSCGSTSFLASGATHFKTLLGELTAAKSQAPGAVSEINFGVIGDFEFTSNMGGASDAEAAIIVRLNNVDGIFSEQLGIQINVQEIETFTDSADPFSDTAVAGELLNELSDYRESTPAQNSQGLTHLYTGRDLDTSTVGVAWSGALCRTRFGAGLSEGNRGPTTDSLIAAHEIGHNFGAPHDGQAGSACEAEAQTFIMAPSVNGSDQFSACSISEMQVDIAAAACITPLPSVDMAISLNGQAPTPLLGNSVTLTFDIANNGTAQAGNVTADISLPNNVSFLSVAASAGTCTSGGGSINCTLGDVPGSSSRNVTVSSTTTGSGVGVFAASVSADVDDNLSNNQVSAQITVTPAVDLVVNPLSSTSVIVDDSTTVRNILENRSTLEATAVSLSISLNSGLRAESASWSAGSCTVAAQQIDCQSGSIAGQSSSTIDLTVTGTTVGTRTYTMTLSATEADANPANNSADGTITVNAVNASGGGNVGEEDGGAAASGPVFLWLLTLGVLLRYRREKPLHATP
jgi:uncharacterized repeat protein (TIGR01451 family)